MNLIKGNILLQRDADAICVTTNGQVNNRNHLIMGKGVALAFARRYPRLPELFGKRVLEGGNRPYVIKGYGKPYIVSLPTKYAWIQPSPIELVVQSVLKLVDLTEEHDWKKVVLTKPGCGNGGLDWEVVRAAIEPLLDDRFYIIEP